MAALLLLVPPRAVAQSIQTIAGGGSEDGRLATESRLESRSSAMDAQGNILIAEDSRNLVRRVDARTGRVSTVAGTGVEANSGDGGPATQAATLVSGIALDRSGNLYIAAKDALRRVDPSGRITTLGPTEGGAYDVAIDGAGNVFVSGNDNRVRRVDAETGAVTVVAGTGEAGFSGDGGPATVAAISPGPIAVDAAGNLFLAQVQTYRVRRVDAVTGTIRTVAGNGERGNVLDNQGDGGPATEAVVNPYDVACDASGTLYVQGYFAVRRVDASTNVITPVVRAGDLRRTDTDPAGNLLVSIGGVLNRVSAAAGTAVAVTGALNPTGDGGPATAAILSWEPRSTAYGPVAGLCVDPAGSLVFADGGFTIASRSSIRRVNRSTGAIETALPVQQFLLDIACDAAGNLYYATSPRDICFIYRVDRATGAVTHVAGGSRVYDDGIPATQAGFRFLSRFDVDPAGNLYVADTYAQRIRRVDAATGIMTTFAGSEAGFGGDGGPATAAKLNYPIGVTTDASGNVYIADTGNHRVRRVDAATGVITTVAGSGTDGFAGDGGPATAAALSVTDVGVDGAGNLYLVTGSTKLALVEPTLVRRVDARTGIITTVAGSGSTSFVGDGGPATAAGFDASDLAVDRAGNIFIRDIRSRRARAVLACTSVAAPALAAPVDGASGQPLAPTLSWTAVPGAFRYDVYLGTDPQATQLAAADQTLTTLTPANLQPGARYYWRVVAKGDAFCSPVPATTSAIRSFTTAGGCLPPRAFTGLAPVGGASVAPPVTLTWQAAEGAASYDVSLGGASPPPPVAQGLTGTSYNATGLVAGSTYYWNVVAHAACDASKTAATAVHSFVVPGSCSAPGAFTLASPSAGASGLAPDLTLSWSASPGATGYDLYLGREADPPLFLAGLTRTSADVTGLLAGSTYRWRVVARTSCDASLTSSAGVRTFTVAGACDAPGATSFLFVPQSVGAGETYVVVWKAAPGLDATGGYLIERSASPGFTPVLDSQSTSHTSVAFLARSAGTLHHRVRAVAGCDPLRTGPVSPTRTTDVSAAQPNVVFSKPPEAVVTTLGEPLEGYKTEFTLENLGATPVTLLVGRQELSSPPFFTIVDPSGGDAGFLTLEPRQPKLFEVRFSGPPNDAPGAYQGLIFASPLAGGLPVTPYAFVNLKVGGAVTATPEIRLCPAGASSCEPTEYVAFPAFDGDDRGRPAVTIDIRNPGTTPMELGAEIGPEVWLVPESGWNASPIPPGASRTVALKTVRSRAPAGSALPRYTYLTLRTRDGKTSRLLVQDNGGASLTSGRSTALDRSERSYLIPSVVNGSSQIGNRFVSRVRLSNAGSEEVQARLLFTPSGEDGFSASVRSATVLVPANDVVSLTDPLVQLFGLTPPAVGTLEVRAASDRVGFLTVTSVVDAPAKGGGAFGFQLPTFQRGEGARVGSPHAIPGVVDTAAYRTNLILAETTGIDAAEVRVTLYDSQGQTVGETTTTVPRYGQRQISRVVRALGGVSDFAAGQLEVSVTSGGGSVASLTTVIDNVDDDAVTYAGRGSGASAPGARPRWALAGGTLKAVVPAIVNGYATFPATDLPYTFRSLMGFSSGTASPATFRLSYTDLNTNLTHAKTVTVPARRTIEYANAVEQLFGLPAGQRSQGPVFVEADVNGILHVKVYSVLPAGSLGDALPVILLSAETLTGGSAQRVLALDGLESSVDAGRGTRSNLILNEVTGAEVTVTVSLYEAGNRSAPIATRDVHLDPLQKVQLSTIFAGLDLATQERQKDRTNVLCVVTPKSGSGMVSAVVTTIDNRTGDTKNAILSPVGGAPGTGSSLDL